MYMIFNILLFVFVVIFMYRYLIPREQVDVKKIDIQYQKIKNNDACLNYLQTLNAIPTWRFSLIYAFGFTILELVFYLLAGGTFDTPTKIFAFWFLYMLNTIFLYKILSTRTWHYMCSDGCLRRWDD